MSKGIECSEEWGVGCGKMNDIGATTCSGCGIILQTPANIRGEIFTLNQKIFFFRKSGEVLEQGQCVSFTKTSNPGSGGIMVRVKYATRQFSYDSYDEQHDINHIFSSIDSASSAQSRSRRKSTNFMETAYSAPPAAAATEPKKIKKEKKSNADDAMEIDASSTASKHYDSDDDAESQDKVPVRLPRKSFKSSSAGDGGAGDDVSISTNSDSMLLEGPGRKRPKSNSNSSNDSHHSSSNSPVGTHRYNNHSFNNSDNLTGDYTSASSLTSSSSSSSSSSFNLNGASQRRRYVLSRTLRRVKLDDALTSLMFDHASTYPITASTLTNTLLFTHRQVNYRIPLDLSVKRGLLCALHTWSVPVRLDAEIEELGAHAWKPDIFMIEVEEILQALPTSLADLSKLNCGERLAGLKMVDYERFKSTMQQSHNEFAVASSNDEVAVKAEPSSGSEVVQQNGSSSMTATSTQASLEETVSVGEALIEVIVNYLIGRGTILPDDVVLSKPFTRTAHSHTLAHALMSNPFMMQYLPLTFVQLEKVMAKAYKEFGSRDELENSKDVKGSKMVSGVETMYGGLKENVVATLIERMAIHKDAVFLDVGSGIGQICIQVAATVGCRCIGVELDPGRHQSAVKLLAAFDHILEQMGVMGRISDLITLRCASITDSSDIVHASSHIFFNNFGPWFTKPMAGQHKETPTQRFCNQLVGCKIGTQVCVLNPLVEVSDWLHFRQFESGREAFSWTSHSIPVYLYTILSDMWKCQSCTILNPIGIEACIACDTVRKSRRTGKAAFICR